MGSNKTPAAGRAGKLQGIALHDGRIKHANLADIGTGTADSDYTEQGIRSGVPVPNQRSNMVLKASGDQTERTSYTVHARYAGHPLPSDGSFVWLDDTSDERHEDNPMPYGHDGYQVITGYNGAIQNKVSTEKPVKPDIVRIHHDKILAAYVGSGAAGFFASVYDPQTGKWATSTANVAWSVGSGDINSPPSVGSIILPSGRVVVYMNDWGNENKQIHAVFSDDEGGTWQHYARGCLNQIPTQRIVSMGVSYSAGIVLMLTGEEADNTLNVSCRMEQWISYDLGCTFDRVGSEFYAGSGVSRTAEEPYDPFVEGLDNGAFLVGYCDKGSGLGSGAAAYRVGVVDPAVPVYTQDLSAISSYTGTGAGNVVNGCVENEAAIDGWRDEDRTCYLLANFSSDVSHVWTAILRSEDGGHTWQKYECYAAIYMVNFHAQKFAANSVGGRAIMLSMFDASSELAEEGFTDMAHLFCLYLGGHARQTVASMDDGGLRFNPIEMLGWGPEAGSVHGSQEDEGRVWLPMDKPQNMGWSVVYTGSNSDTFNANLGSLDVTTGTGTYYWTLAPTANVKTQTNAAVGFKVTVVSGGSRTKAECGIDLRLTDRNQATTTACTRHANVRLCLEPTGFRLLDMNNGGATIADRDFDLTTPAWFYLQLKLASSTSDIQEVALFYGRDAEAPGGAGGLGTQRRALTVATTQSNLHNAAAANPSSNSVLAWGHIENGDCVSRWEMMGHTWAAGPFAAGQSISNYVGTWRSHNYTNAAVGPSSLNGREWPTVPALLIDGVRISAGDGPAKSDDTWTITPRYDFAISNIDPNSQPSPRVPWRSKEETAGAAMTAQEIVWDLESATSGAGGTIDFGNYAVAVMLFGCNFKTAYLQKLSGGSWVTIAQLDAAHDLDDLEYLRRGSTVYPDPARTGGSSPRWFHRQSLVGDTLDLGANTGSGSQYKHIRGNTEGGWYVDGTSTLHTRVPRVSYDVDDLDAGDPASATAGGAKAAIWRRNFGALIVNTDLGIDPRIRLYLPAQANADGYFQIGSCFIGEVAIFGHQFDRGLSWTAAPNSQDFSRPDGARRVQTLGPIRRSVEFAWSETAIDTTSIGAGLDDSKEALPGSANSPDWVSTAASGYPVAATTDTISLMDGIIRQTFGPAQPVVFLPRIPTRAGSAAEVYQLNEDRLVMYGRIDSDHGYQIVQGNEGVDEVQRLGKIKITEEV